MYRRRGWIAAVVAISVVAVWPNAALADDDDDDDRASVITTTVGGLTIMETRESQETCTKPRLLQPFSVLGDRRDYVLAPGGSFEDRGLDGWQVKKATKTDDGSPLESPRPPTSSRNDDDDDDDDEDGDNERSLKVPAGGSAMSPAMCVDINYPIFRFMAKAKQKKGALKVEIVYPDADPVFQAVTSVTAPATSSWRPTDDIELSPERGGAAPGMRRVALRFSSVGVSGATGEWRIDDIYVDPRRRI